ncbi:MAG: type II toxin-antitoxin system PemK/MazF family toxin [Thermoanaerobaculia bacterium]
MGSYRFGDIVYILFPFSDHSGAKERPAVVISCQKFNRLKPEIILLPVTSQLRHGDTWGTVTIGDWQKAGLAKPSVIKPFPHTAIQKDVRRRVGELTETDRDQLGQMLSKVLSPNF